MKTVLIVYHSMTGGARQMAEAAARGARSEPEIGISLLPAAQATAADVLAADGYGFVCPENLAAMSGLMKDFFDRTYYDALDQVNGRPFFVAICAGSDGRSAAQQIVRIATGWRLKSIAPPLIVCTHAQAREAIFHPKSIATERLQECEELGATLATGTALGIF